MDHLEEAPRIEFGTARLKLLAELTEQVQVSCMDISPGVVYFVSRDSLYALDLFTKSSQQISPLQMTRVLSIGPAERLAVLNTIGQVSVFQLQLFQPIIEFGPFPDAQDICWHPVEGLVLYVKLSTGLLRLDSYSTQETARLHATGIQHWTVTRSYVFLQTEEVLSCYSNDEFELLGASTIPVAAFCALSDDTVALLTQTESLMIVDIPSFECKFTAAIASIVPLALAACGETTLILYSTGNPNLVVLATDESHVPVSCSHIQITEGLQHCKYSERIGFVATGDNSLSVYNLGTLGRGNDLMFQYIDRTVDAFKRELAEDIGKLVHAQVQKAVRHIFQQTLSAELADLKTVVTDTLKTEHISNVQHVTGNVDQSELVAQIVQSNNMRLLSSLDPIQVLPALPDSQKGQLASALLTSYKGENNVDLLRWLEHLFKELDLKHEANRELVKSIIHDRTPELAPCRQVVVEKLRTAGR